MRHLRMVAFGATIVVLLTLRGTDAHGQSGGFFLVAADSAATSRELSDTSGVCTIYVVQEALHAGAEFTAVRFKISNNDFTGIWLGDTSGFATVGNSQDGIAVSYGTCLQPPILVLSVRYFCTGTSGCTTVTLAPDPSSASGQIASYDCTGTPLSPLGIAELCVNGVVVPDDTGFGICDCTSPVEEGTWGRIKAIFQ